MTSDDTDDLLKAVVVCEGNIKDPKFINQFPNIVKRLKCILCKGKEISDASNVISYNPDQIRSCS